MVGAKYPPCSQALLVRSIPFGGLLILTTVIASRELHDAFNNLVSSPATQRGLIATVKEEKLVPAEAIPSPSGDFFHDLNFLDALLKDDEAAYVLLRRHDGSPDGYVAVTYVPDRAPVRQKMLFAATRLTLVRELGTERFRETYFTTAKLELTAEGWRKHEKHTQLKAPLTEEEQALQGVKEAEAEASRGTGHRASHLSGHTTLSISEEGLRALKELPSGGNNFVQLVGLAVHCAGTGAYVPTEIRRSQRNDRACRHRKD